MTSDKLSKAKKDPKTPAAGPAKDAAKPTRKTSTDPNKQPSFEEQEDALKPAAEKKPAKARDFRFEITEVRLLGGTKAEADVLCRYTDKDYNPVLTEKVTVKFKKRADDFDSGGELADAFLAAGHLDGKLTPSVIDKMRGDLYGDFVMKGAMALRDEQICKGTTGETRANLDGLESIAVSSARSLPGGKAEIKVTLAVSANGSPQGAKSYTINFTQAPEGTYSRGWVSAHNALEQFVKDGHLKKYTWDDSDDIHNNPLRVGWAQEVSQALELM